MMSSTRSWLTVWGPSLLWMLLIFLGSSLSGGDADEAARQASGVEDPVDIQRIKDAVHVTEYGILMLLLARSLRLRDHSAAIPIGFAITVCYGISDEIHQYFVPGRYPGMDDIIRNTVGAGVGAVIVYVWEQYLKKRKAV